MSKEGHQEIHEDPEEEKTQQIFITKQDYDRLDGNEDLGKWYEHIRFSDVPSKRFCIKTKVPLVSVEDGVFDPALSEPDIIVERCKEVTPQELKKEEKKKAEKEAKKSLVLKRGQIVWYELSIAGITTHEEAKVGTISKKKGVFYLDNGDGNDPSGPYYISDGSLVDHEGSDMLGSSVRILDKKPKDSGGSED